MQKFSVLELLNLICAASPTVKSPIPEEKTPSPPTEKAPDLSEEVIAQEDISNGKMHTDAYANFLTRHEGVVERTKRR